MSRRRKETEAALQERKVSVRVAQALANAGVSTGQVLNEVLGLMPQDFVVAYLELADRALDLSPSGTGKQLSAWADRGGKGGGSVGKGGIKSKGYVKDPKALARKSRIDSELLKLADRIKIEGRRGRSSGFMDSRLAGKCSGCKNPVLKGWRHCAHCGTEIKRRARPRKAEGG